MGQQPQSPFTNNRAKGTVEMLKSLGKPSLLLKLGAWRCMCLRSQRLSDGLRASIRPFYLFGYACWCDRLDID